MSAVQASDDPLIRFVVATDAVARSARQAWLAKVGAPSEAAHQRLAEAEFRLLGAGVYPDGTFTPRISYGAVRGWQGRGETIGPFTTFAGLVDPRERQAALRPRPALARRQAEVGERHRVRLHHRQ